MSFPPALSILSPCHIPRPEPHSFLILLCGRGGGRGGRLVHWCTVLLSTLAPRPPGGACGQAYRHSRMPSSGTLSPGCRAVELSRLRRGAVEPVVEDLPVEPCRALSSLSRLTPCAGASSFVEVCRGLSSSCRAVHELSSNVELMNSCLAVEPGNAYAYSFA